MATGTRCERQLPFGRKQEGCNRSRRYSKGETRMELKHLLLGATALALAGIPVLAGTAVAQDTIYVPLLTYRTGPFAGSGIPIANGMSDYLAMLNERDGGIGGVKVVI